ncbi:MAG: hypothetical protein SFX74_01515 [Fimbriimonadaceae bacterium]|nr:hypothetical protein [Fimbriimonadaceae bacterium]
MVLAPLLWMVTETAPTKSVYYIGNSVTDALNYGGVAAMGRSRGITWNWGRHMIPGAPLHWLYTHPDDGFMQEPYGHYRRALTEYAWDAVTVQPFDRHLDGDEGDVRMIQSFFDLAVAKNPRVVFYIYARWPRMTWKGKGYSYDKNDYDPGKDRAKIDLGRVDDYQERWAAKYTGGWDETNESRDYFDRLVAELRKKNPGHAKQFRIIPIGEVFAQLDGKMRAGKVPGYRSIYEVYSDSIHMGRLGSAIAGMTVYATITGELAVGLPTETYGKLDPEAVRSVQETVDAVVRVSQ